MNTLDEDCEPLDAMVEDFVGRYRRGESPLIEQYVATHPQMEESIRRTLTAALMLEKVKSEALSPRIEGKVLLPGPPPPRLGDYRIIREIGRGGMGIVYEAEQETLRRRVALKIVHETALSPALLQRFIREARATAGMHHTNIVPIFAVGYEEGVHYYAMQFIEGRGLDAVIRSWSQMGNKPQPAADRFATIARIGVQIVEALGYAHENGILHRDVKPSNLMLDAHGTVWLTDFGLARVDEPSDLTRPMDMIGTLRYLAPERLAGRCDAKSDLFGAGLVLYELLTLRPARDAARRDELLKQVGDTPPPPRQIDPQIPKDLETIVLTAMAREPAHRYASAHDLAHDLRCFLEGRPIRARRTSTLRRLHRWSQRNPALAMVSGSAIVLLLALTVGSILVAVRFHHSAIREIQAGSRAESARQTAEAALAHAYPADGLQAARHNNNGEAALWFANAALLSPPQSEGRSLNSTRARMFARGALTPIAAILPISGTVSSLHFDPTGKYLLTSGPEQGCQIWKLDGEQNLSLPINSNLIASACWRADGNTLALGTSTGEVSVWTFPDFKPVASLPMGRPISSLQFSPDGRYLVVAAASIVRVWDSTLAAFMEPALPQASEVSQIRLCQDGGKLLIVTRFGALRTYRFPPGSADALVAVQANPGAVAGFVENGTQFVVAETGDITWRDSQSGQMLHKLENPGSPDWLACDVAARRFVVGAGNQIQAFDAHEARQISSVLNYLRGERCAAIDPSGQMLLSASPDRQPALWDVASGTQVPIALTAMGEVRSASFSSDGQLIATVGKSGLLRVWRLPQSPLGHIQVPISGQSVTMQLDPSGQYALPSPVSSQFGYLPATRVIELATAHPVGVEIAPGGALTYAVFSPDGLHVATANKGPANSLQLWEWKSGRRIGEPIALPAPADGLCYDPTGKWLAVICADGERLIVGVSNARVTASWRGAPSVGPEKLVRSGAIRFSPDGHDLLTWGSNDVEVRDPATGTLRYPPLHHGDVCGDVCFSPDGALLATAGWDKQVRVWDFKTGHLISPPLMHGEAVHLVRFVGNGEQLLSGCMDGVFRLWNWRSAQLAYQPTRDDEVAMSAGATPDGRWVLISSGQGALRVWDRQSGNLVSPPLACSAACWAIDISSSGRYAVVTGVGAQADVFDLSALYEQNPTDLQEQVRWCEILSGQRLDSGQLVPLSEQQWMSLWSQRKMAHHF